MWTLVERPGYFGKKRDEKIDNYNQLYGEDNWTIVWKTPWNIFEFLPACRYFYERSYFEFLKDSQEDLDFITSFAEVIDNDISNIESGLDYTKQEATSTHIQDIAVRNVLSLLGLSFKDVGSDILTIRGQDSNGYKYNPGQVPFLDKKWIDSPSLRPKWALPGSVEDFWQSNKWVAVRDTARINVPLIMDYDTSKDELGRLNDNA